MLWFTLKNNSKRWHWSSQSHFMYAHWPKITWLRLRINDRSRNRPLRLLCGKCGMWPYPTLRARSADRRCMVDTACRLTCRAVYWHVANFTEPLEMGPMAAFTLTVLLFLAVIIAQISVIVTVKHGNSVATERRGERPVNVLHDSDDDVLLFVQVVIQLLMKMRKDEKAKIENLYLLSDAFDENVYTWRYW